MKQKETYDRKEVGRRLKNCRKQLNWSREYAAEKAGLAEKYYADIERGTCGMSIETLLAITKLYGMTMDGLIYGAEEQGQKAERNTILIKNLESLPEEARNYCVEMLLLFMKGIKTGSAGKEAPADIEQV